ncbi:MAG: hypothetical protein AAFU66_07985, partial [Pseudomonadota bacterium]
MNESAEAGAAESEREPSGQTAIITARVDDAFDLYVNGVLVMSGDWWLDNETAVIELSPGDVIAIDATDLNAGALAFVDIAMANGVRLGTSQDWVVSTKIEEGWADQAFDDSAWTNATEYGGRTLQPWFRGDKFDDDAIGQWIWTDDFQNDDKAYFRFTVPEFDEPEPVGDTTGPIAVVESVEFNADRELSVVLEVSYADESGFDPRSVVFSDASITVGDETFFAATTVSGPLNVTDGFATYTFRHPDGPSGWTAGTHTISASGDVLDSLGNSSPAFPDVTVTIRPEDLPPPVEDLATITARVDDAFDLYVNGKLVLSGDWWHDNETAQVALEYGDVIAIDARDVNAGAVAFVDIVMPNGERLGTSSEWLVSTEAEAGWREKSFDDSAWTTATEHGDRTLQPWFRGDKFDTETVGHWIWTDDIQNDDQVFFRYTVGGVKDETADEGGDLRLAPVARPVVDEHQLPDSGG